MGDGVVPGEGTAKSAARPPSAVSSRCWVQYTPSAAELVRGEEHAASTPSASTNVTTPATRTTANPL